jgi:hypothetical protein
MNTSDVVLAVSIRTPRNVSSVVNVRQPLQAARTETRDRDDRQSEPKLIVGIADVANVDLEHCRIAKIAISAPSASNAGTYSAGLRLPAGDSPP